MAEGMEAKKLNPDELGDINGGLRGGDSYSSGSGNAQAMQPRYMIFTCKHEDCEYYNWSIGAGLIPLTSMLCPKCQRPLTGKS